MEAFEAAAKAKEIAEEARRQQIRSEIEREAEEEVERMAKAKEEEDDDEAAVAAAAVKEEEEGGGMQSAQPAFLRDYLSGQNKKKGQDDDEDDEEEGGSSNSSSARLVGERAALKTAGERRKEAKEKDDWGSYASVHRPGVSSGPPLLGRSVLVSGLIARPELNGTRGVAVTYNAETGRYNVRMPQGEVIALKPTNLAAATEGSTGFGEAGSAEAKAAAEAKEKERKASIGQRMAAKRNAKGIGWASKSSVSGMFASEGKRQEAAARRASNPIKEDYDEVCVCVNGTHQQGSSSAHSPLTFPPLPFPPSP